MSLIILKDEDIERILQHGIKRKADAYNYLIGKGLLQQADYIFYEWKALTELAELLGIKFESITSKHEDNIFKSNNRLTMELLEILVMRIYFHFLNHKLLHESEFENLIKELLKSND